MKHLHIHIGWPKTGTSGLQSYWTRNADYLLSHGLAYYRSQLDSIGSVARQIARGDDMTTQAEAFAAWTARQEAGQVLISSEGLASTRMESFRQFVRPEAWDRISVLAYLRPQPEYLESWYKQTAKWGSKQSTRSMLVASSKPMRTSHYASLLAPWEALCAEHRKGRVTVRIFDPGEMAGGDVIRDAMAVLGIPYRPDVELARSRQNVSPSAALIGMYLKLPKIDRLQQINRRIVASGLPGVTGSADLFDRETVAKIEGWFAAENEQLRARYFPERPRLFRPSAPTPPPGAAEQAAFRDLLIETIREMRGEDVAAQARAALHAAAQP
ncbi:hypothetical protein SAMN05421538_102222 [Paracoccus isoporae]|uniref:Uncharacterized protein n=1 Tax=Paracoccus isoporae TaxID=591205 RepID=A0A1G6WW67_9RHOB|nr:hypothetical protein [Paracoccus isoporae]SDD69326.1 hypothetical protein SAMN05421538_102222 [Paracoccus isoporae]